jgi:hypothetical protein
VDLEGTVDYDEAWTKVKFRARKYFMVIIVFKGLGGKIQPLTDEESPAG